MRKNKLLLLLVLLMAATGAWAQTTVNGLFTVNADGDQVQFASGNLRYTSGAWSFFDHQYDYYAEYSAASWDKFGWSTSGTTYGMSTSTNENQYKGDFVDWGNAVGTGWRTLSNDEWAYVVNTRSGSTIGTTANARFAKAVVCDVKGLILFPDTYTHPNGVTAPTGINETGATGMNGNSYDATAWALMESAGCVFLPTAGGRYHYSNPTLVINAGNEGCYWSSTSDNSTATLLSFKSNTFDPSITDSPRMGYSVRLVKSVTTYTVSLADNTEDADSWKGNVNDAQTDVNLPIKKLEGGEKVTLKYKGHLKVKDVKATSDAKPAGKVVDLSTYSGTSYEVTEDVTFTGTTNNEISILYKGDDYEVTLDNVNAPKCFIAAQEDDYNINVKLKGTSRLMGIYTQNVYIIIGEAEAGGTVILVDENTPLGSSAATITINGGTVKAKTSSYSALYDMLEVNGGAVYLEAADGYSAVNLSAEGKVTLYGWNGSAWETYTDHRYLSTDNSKAPSEWTW